MSNAINDVLIERKRQIEAEGWTQEHDDQHVDGSLAQAAACYALNVQRIPISCGDSTIWPWAQEWWKPKGRRRDLVRAAALLLAEIDRIDRMEAHTSALLDLMVEQDEEWCTCGAIHNQDEIGKPCKACGKLGD